jgi:hypothetical protein
LWEEKEDSTGNSDPNLSVHDSRSLGFRKATRELRQTTIIEEID